MLILWTLGSCHTVYTLHVIPTDICSHLIIDLLRQQPILLPWLLFDWARLQVQKFQVEDRKRWRYIRCAAKSQQKNLGRIAWHPLLKLNGTFESMIFSLSVGYVTMEGNHFPADRLYHLKCNESIPKMMPCLKPFWYFPGSNTLLWLLPEPQSINQKSSENAAVIGWGVDP